ncbi:MAG TPA: 2-succinylbenzoate-CoA ligase, partial [Chloroflexota bacterium]|nr:2-succinylbenzoate-CoA ligase [Chloroflexota bacterium]
EVEAVLLAHSSVAEAAVFGVPDAEWGQTVAAAIALRGPLNVEELRVFCRARLAGFKVPRRLVVLEALPRNAAGKILRRELRAAFST